MTQLRANDLVCEHFQEGLLRDLKLHAAKRPAEQPRGFFPQLFSRGLFVRENRPQDRMTKSWTAAS